MEQQQDKQFFLAQETGIIQVLKMNMRSLTNLSLYLFDEELNEVS